MSAQPLTAARARMSAGFGEADTALRVAYSATALYGLLFVFAAVIHYIEFRTGRVDLGHMVQAIWNTQHGRFLEETTLHGQQQNRLGYHVDPFLLVFVPLFWVWSSPLLLPVFQALAVASGALPVFWLARKHLSSSRAAAHFALAYLLYPATQFNAFTNLFGFSVFAIGLAITVFNFLWVIPHFSPTGADPFAGRYRAVGGTPQGIAHKLVTDPLAFVHAVASGHKAVYLAFLLIPFLGLALLEPLLLLGAVPDLAINLLSSHGDQTAIPYHWTAGIVPFVVAASIFGAARFKRQAGRLSLGVLAVVACTAIYSPILALTSDLRVLGSPVQATERHALSLIPEGARVAASNLLGGHLSERRFSYTFPYVARARWIVVDINDRSYAGGTAQFKRDVLRYESDKAWRTVYSSRGVVVLHKRGPSGH